MYSKILVPLDGSNVSEQIVPYARFFADAYGIPVELLRITDPDARPPIATAALMASTIKGKKIQVRRDRAG